MDWIEKLLHFSPDEGTGATEVLATVAAVGCVVWLLTRFVRRRGRAEVASAHVSKPGDSSP